VKALDQALDRMPPPNFDTAGLGRAFSTPLPGSADSSGTVYPWRAPLDSSALLSRSLPPDQGAAYSRGTRGYGETGYYGADPAPYPAEEYDPRYGGQDGGYDPRYDGRGGAPYHPRARPPYAEDDARREEE
jgi:hypothetical protein